MKRRLDASLILCLAWVLSACGNDRAPAADPGGAGGNGSNAGGGGNGPAGSPNGAPQNDAGASAAVKDGGTTDAGPWAPANLPSWVPAPGTIANISLNTMADVDPCPPQTSCAWSDVEHQQGTFAWVGGTYTPGVGSWGRLSHWGGGHNAYSGNEVYVFDFDTRLWSRKKDPYPGSSDTPYNEWAEFDGVLGEPVPPHTYRQYFGLSPQWGGGPEGSSVQLHYAAIARVAGHSGGSHIYDNATGKWTRYANTLCPVSLMFRPIAFDSKRGKFHALYAANGESGTGIATLDTTTRDWTVRGDIGVGPANGFTEAGYTVADYLPTLDEIVVIEKGTGGATPSSPAIWTLDVAKLVSGAPVGWVKETSNAYTLPPLVDGHSMGWAPLLGKFGMYYVDLGSTVIYLKPPAAVGGTWEWSSETFGGAAPLSADTDLVRSSYNRFNWVEALHSWAWYTRRDSSVQLWRPAGT